MSTASWLDTRLIRIRPDLEVVERRGGAQRTWVVKDPLALEYFQFGEGEWFILDGFANGKSPREILQEYNRQFAPEQISEQEIQAFIGRARSDGLVLVERNLGFGSWLHGKYQGERQRDRFMKPFQILCLRFRGVDPNALLSGLAPIGWLLFSPVALVLVCLASLLSLVFFASEFETIMVRMPQLQAILSGQNLLLILLAVSFVKVLHEIGHGLACQRFGGEVHELGFMLLAFAPCLYCNVSDAWMFRSRWKRMAVSLGGVYIELILANLFFFLWFFSAPGTFNSLCLNIVLICSISTLLVNGNPLLRYDGYYVLSDWWEQPNLAMRSRQALWGWLRACFVQSARVTRDISTSEWPLAVYAVLSIVYRFFVVGLILWFVHQTLVAWEMEFLFFIVAALVLIGMALPVVASARRFSFRRNQPIKFRWFHAAVSTGMLFLIGWFLFFVPISYRVSAPVIVEPTRSSNVYADVAGFLSWSASPGSRVGPGETVAQLNNPDVLFRHEELQDQIREQNLVLANLQKRSNLDSQVTFQIPVVEATLEDLNRQLEKAQEDVDRLVIRAESAGTLVAAAPRYVPQDQELSLTSWQGTPLDSANVGCWLERGEVVGIVTSPKLQQAILYVPQSEIEFVRQGQTVRLMFHHLPGEVIDGEVLLLTQENVDSLPESIIHEGDITMETDRFGKRVPLETIYRVVVSIDSGNRSILPGSGGRGKIVANRQTVAQRISRWARRTFTFDW